MVSLIKIANYIFNVADFAYFLIRYFFSKSRVALPQEGER